MHLFFALTVSIRWRLLFPTLSWSINSLWYKQLFFLFWLFLFFFLLSYLFRYKNSVYLPVAVRPWHQCREPFHVAPRFTCRYSERYLPTPPTYFTSCHYTNNCMSPKRLSVSSGRKNELLE
jgi:hypothetical protein